MVIMMGSMDGDEIRIYPRLLDGFAQGGFDHGFMRVPGATGYSPGVAVVHPWGTVLQEDGPIANEDYACCTVEPPVLAAASALDPSVSVAMRHTTTLFLALHSFHKVENFQQMRVG